MYNQNNNTYFENTVKTATPAKLVEMLYANAVERLEKSKTLIKEKNFVEANKQIIRVEDIINELNISLNMEIGGEVSKNLRAMYNYMYRRLLEANTKKDIEIVDEVQGLIKELLDTWREAMKKSVNTIKEMSANTNKSKFDIQT